MATELRFSVALLFKGAQKFAEQLGSIGNGLGRVAQRVSNLGRRLHAAGERMTAFGTKVGLTTALLSGGGEAMHAAAERISELAKGMEQAMATLAATSGLASNKLHEICERALRFAGTHPGVTAEQSVANAASAAH